ncbi:MAG: DUF374 domain-containing protein, partial [Gammaproteobacteria bacterium]|nr:DUF374 domain-containing protein [Gammaproteobacteria bacterium]
RRSPRSDRRMTALRRFNYFIGTPLLRGLTRLLYWTYRVEAVIGAEVIRGSAKQSGALALRDQHEMMKNGYSIVTTPDGSEGPQHELKTGVMVMAGVGGVPKVPVSCAAERAWYLDRWDRFMIPKPFSRVVLGIGEPYHIPAGTPLSELEPHRLNVQQAVRSLMADYENRLYAD